MQASSVESIVENTDLLWGAKAIGRALGLNERQTFHRLENNQIPGARKIGKNWIASKSTLTGLGKPAAAQ